MSEPVLSTPVLHFTGNGVNSSLRRGGGKISMGTICQKNREQLMVPGPTLNSLEKKLWICLKDILSKKKKKKCSDCFHTLLKKMGIPWWTAHHDPTEKQDRQTTFPSMRKKWFVAHNSDSVPLEILLSLHIICQTSKRWWRAAWKLPSPTDRNTRL